MMSTGRVSVYGRHSGPERLTATEMIDDVQHVVVLEPDDAGRYWETGLTPAERIACATACPVQPSRIDRGLRDAPESPEIRGDKVATVREAIAHEDYESDEKLDWTVDAVFRDLEALMRPVEA